MTGSEMHFVFEEFCVYEKVLKFGGCLSSTMLYAFCLLIIIANRLDQDQDGQNVYLIWFQSVWHSDKVNV